MNLYRPASSASIIIRQFTGTFQDVYTWAGNIRTVRIGKDGSMFCYPEHIRSQMRTLFGRLRRGRYLRDLTPDEFVLKATTFLATLNAIHPFRDGNGRTQLAFMALLAACAGHSLLLDRLHARRFPWSGNWCCGYPVCSGDYGAPRGRVFPSLGKSLFAIYRLSR